MIKTAMIGAGSISQAHGTAMKNLGAEIVGVYDKSIDVAKRVAGKYGAVAYETPEEAMEKADMIHLCTPPSKRMEYAEMAMKAGKHIYFEKPVASNSKDAQKLVEMEKKYNIKTCVGFHNRFGDAFQALKSKLESGVLGDVNMIYFYRGCTLGASFGLTNQSWRTDPKLATGMTIESLCHDFDMLHLLNQEVVSVKANTVASRPSLPMFDDNVAAVMTLKSGATFVIQTSWSSCLDFSLRGIIGSNGSAALRGPDDFSYEDLRVKTYDMAHEEVTVFGEDYSFEIPAFTRINEYFIGCIKNDKPCEINVAYGLKMLRISEAILESSKTDKTVVL